MNNKYKIASEIREWRSVSADRKDAIIQFCVGGGKIGWNYAHTMVGLMGRVDVETKKNLFSTFISNATSYDFGEDSQISGMIDILNFDFVKSEVFNQANPRLHKAILGLSPLSLDEETLGLRGLSVNSSCPRYIFSRKYKPSLEAMSAVPTMKRLKILENLVSDITVGYNIFEHISEDDMEALLFGSTLKYLNRVSYVKDAFTYFRKLSVKSLVKIDYNCESCGEYSISLDSYKVHCTEDFSRTFDAGNFVWDTCVFCKSNRTVKLKTVE